MFLLLVRDGLSFDWFNQIVNRVPSYAARKNGRGCDSIDQRIQFKLKIVIILPLFLPFVCMIPCYLVWVIELRHRSQ